MDIPQRKRAGIKPPERPHRCDATIAHIDAVIAEVTAFHVHIRLSQERWDSGE